MNLGIVVHAGDPRSFKYLRGQCQQDEPHSHDSQQIRKNASAAHAVFPEQEDQARGETQDHPGIEGVENRSGCVGARIDPEFAPGDSRRIYKAMQIVAQGEQREQARRDQQQGPVPAAAAPAESLTIRK